MSESELVRELRALAGVKNEDAFVVRHDGVAVKVSYTGGSSSRLVMIARYDDVAHATPVAGYRGGGALSAIRPMRIALRPERESERQGKASGMDIEVQTGDATFDDAVYVDTLTPAEVSVHVLSEGTRRAILDLFALEFTSIAIDDVQGDVRAEISTFASLHPPSQPGRRAIDAFARLCRGLPRVDKAAGVHASHPLGTWSVLLGVLAFILFIVSFPIYFAGTARDQCDDGGGFARCVGPGLAGCVGGLLAAVIAGLLATQYTRRYRGRSDSSRVGSSYAMAIAALAFLTVANVLAFVISRL